MKLFAGFRDGAARLALFAEDSGQPAALPEWKKGGSSLNRTMLVAGAVITLTFALTAREPLCFVVSLVGISCNLLVVAVNNWKMPVVGLFEDTEIHQRMILTTRCKWLGDVIPVGIGKASIGDFLICAGFLGVTATGAIEGWVTPFRLFLAGGVFYWLIGWANGFHFLDKSREYRKQAAKNFPIALILICLGHLLGVRGCNVGTLQALASGGGTTAMLPEKKQWRDLGTMLPPPRRIKPLNQIEREQQADLEKLRQQQQKEAREDAQRIINQFTRNPPVQHVEQATRKGPFCRITCTVHHNDHYDVEVMPELCKANWIPPTAAYVPGWWKLDQEGKWEAMNLWPGPAQTGFRTYKLYWK